MADNKSKDDSFFNCSEEYELRYVSGRYEEEQKVFDFLKAKCEDGTIHYLTHAQLYQLIQTELGYPVP